MTQKMILDFLSANKSMLRERFGVTKIGLFGSYSKKMDTEQSDIDLLVEMPSRFDDYYALKEFLENAFGKPIDLGQEKAMRAFIRSRIEQEIIYV